MNEEQLRTRTKLEGPPPQELHRRARDLDRALRTVGMTDAADTLALMYAWLLELEQRTQFADLMGTEQKLAEWRSVLERPTSVNLGGGSIA